MPASDRTNDAIITKSSSRHSVPSALDGEMTGDDHLRPDEDDNGLGPEDGAATGQRQDLDPLAD